MGFFSKLTGGGGLAGALIGGALAIPTGGLSVAAGAGIGGLAGGLLGGDLFGTGQQVDALREAGRIEEAALLQAQQFQQRAEAAGAPFREAAVGALGQLQEITQAPLGESQRFQQNLRDALVAQQATLAGFGLGDSTTAAQATGQLTSRLASEEERNRLAILQGLAGGGQAGFGTALGGLQLQSGLAGRRAQTAAEIGGAQSAGTQATIQTGLDLAGLLLGQQRKV